MLNGTNKPFVLSFIMLNVIMLSVVKLNVVAPFLEPSSSVELPLGPLYNLQDL
jgi:hypothetical protein